MEPIFFDIHSHLNHPDFNDDWRDVVKKCLDSSIWTIVVGNDMETSGKAVEIAGKHEQGIYATVGLHPTDANLEIGFPSELGNPISKLRELANNPKVVAIGECGLEYFRIKDEGERERQKKIFREQIELAIELDKSLVIHCREAHDDVIKILEEYKEERLRGDLHFFSGNLEQAKKYIELGFLISFTGVITFAKDYNEVIKNIPLQKIMIETDAPYVAPAPYRGKRNEPAYVVEVAKKIAEIKGVSLEEVAKVTTQNALRLFGIN